MAGVAMQDTHPADITHPEDITLGVVEVAVTTVTTAMTRGLIIC